MSDKNQYSDGQNKRKSTRVECDYYIDIVIEDGSAFAGQVTNISLKGVYIISDEIPKSLNKGDIVKFEIMFSETNSDFDIQGSAKVVRNSPSEGFALRFADIDGENIERLRQYLTLNIGTDALMGDEFKE